MQYTYTKHIFRSNFHFGKLDKFREKCYKKCIDRFNDHYSWSFSVWQLSNYRFYSWKVIIIVLESDENNKNVHKIILDNRTVKLIEVSKTLKISKECVGHILNECLGMPKLCAKWVPRKLTVDQNQ